MLLKYWCFATDIKSALRKGERLMENKEYWGVCVGEGKDTEIVKVYSDYDFAIQESAMWTLETGVPHKVLPVVKKEK